MAEERNSGNILGYIVQTGKEQKSSHNRIVGLTRAMRWWVVMLGDSVQVHHSIDQIRRQFVYEKYSS